MDGGGKAVKVTRHQREILDFCRSEVDAGRRFPTIREIGIHMGCADGVTNSTRQTLLRLTKKGVLIHTEGRGWCFPQNGASRNELIKLVKSLISAKPLPSDPAWEWAEKVMEKTR